MLGIFKKNHTSTTPVETAPTFDITSGPRSEVTNCNPCFVRKESDWNPEHGLLWVRQNNGENRYDPTPDRDGDCIKHINIVMAEDDIVKYVTEYLDHNLTNRFHVVILTADAHGMHPNHISVEFNRGATMITSSSFCDRHNVDNNIIRLVQKLLDSQKVKINFKKALESWNDQEGLFICA